MYDVEREPEEFSEIFNRIITDIMENCSGSLPCSIGKARDNTTHSL